MFYAYDNNGMGSYYGGHTRIYCDSSKIVPVAEEGRTRAFATLGCVYVRRT